MQRRTAELSDQIKIIKARMREISDLRTQIINYHKTRDVYVAYRKAGYSKQFLAEHESDIIIHKAAKKYFDEVGLTKLPTLKSLTAEFEDLRVKKNRAYTEYHQARADMKELQIAKSNIDTLMGTGGTDHEKKRQTQKY